MNNNQKITFNIDIDALTDQVFNAAQSDNKHEINELMNDF